MLHYSLGRWKCMWSHYRLNAFVAKRLQWNATQNPVTFDPQHQWLRKQIRACPFLRIQLHCSVAANHINKIHQMGYNDNNGAHTPSPSLSKTHTLSQRRPKCRHTLWSKWPLSAWCSSDRISLWELYWGDGSPFFCCLHQADENGRAERTQGHCDITMRPHLFITPTGHSKQSRHCGYRISECDWKMLENIHKWN